MSLMTGDEKHDLAETSTYDVLWSCGSATTASCGSPPPPRAGLVPAVEGGLPRGVLRRPGRQRLHPAPPAGRLRDVRLAARAPSGPGAGARGGVRCGVARARAAARGRERARARGPGLAAHRRRPRPPSTRRHRHRTPSRPGCAPPSPRSSAAARDRPAAPGRSRAALGGERRRRWAERAIPCGAVVRRAGPTLLACASKAGSGSRS
jgi:hypothetical protein